MNERKSDDPGQLRKTSFDDEQREKDEAFLALDPLERLHIHEELRRRIWGTPKGVGFAGMKVKVRGLE